MDFGKVLGGLGSVVGAVNSAVQHAVEDAFKKGFEAGREDMRQAILAATQSVQTIGYVPASAEKEKQAPAFKLSEVKAKRVFKGRVSKGSIGDGINLIFLKEGGLTIPEIYRRLHEAGINASRDGVGVNLRRKENVRYRREGEKWFPITEPQRLRSGAEDTPDLQNNQAVRAA